MKPTRYPNNGRGLYVEHQFNREGPPSVFVVLYKGVSRLCKAPIEVSRVLGSARYTDASKALREWCEEIHQSTLDRVQSKLDMARVKSEGFGPEAHVDEDPSAATKMVV